MRKKTSDVEDEEDWVTWYEVLEVRRWRGRLTYTGDGCLYGCLPRDRGPAPETLRTRSGWPCWANHSCSRRLGGGGVGVSHLSGQRAPLLRLRVALAGALPLRGRGARTPLLSRSRGSAALIYVGET